MGITSACTYRTTPPGPNTLSGTIAEAGYSLHRWDQGLTLLILYGAPAGFACEGSGNTSNPKYELECHVGSGLNSDLSWELRSESGNELQITIGQQQFGLSDEALFIAMETNGAYEVEKIDRRLSDVEFEHDAILRLAEVDPAIQAFFTALR